LRNRDPDQPDYDGKLAPVAIPFFDDLPKLPIRAVSWARASPTIRMLTLLPDLPEDHGADLNLSLQ
jgi:hypothetical protein